MRQFQTLDSVTINDETRLVSLTCTTSTTQHVEVAMRREGDHLAISFSLNALEFALRPRFSEFMRALSHIQPVDGLNTTRQVGTGNAFVALGLHTDGSLILRPTFVADATGYISFNLKLTPQASRALTEWIGVTGAQLPKPV
jgi:hypothetical protein